MKPPLALNLPDKYRESGANPLFVKYERQRLGAFRRGVGWAITFREWVDWWGEDIKRRGVGHDRLQMQRIADVGPYRLDNIRKGYPRDNSKTARVVRRNRRQARILVERKIRIAAFKAAVVESPFYGRPPPRKKLGEVEGWAKTLCRTEERQEAQPLVIMTPYQKPPQPPKLERRVSFLRLRRRPKSPFGL